MERTKLKEGYRTLAPKQCYGTGKRKQAIARVFISPGEGEITVNKRSLEEYFPIERLQKLAIEPLVSAELLDKCVVRATVSCGGIAGQSGAIRHGIARALLEFDASLHLMLRKKGYLTRDARVKERKKYGQRGARARFQFSKR